MSYNASILKKIDNQFQKEIDIIEDHIRFMEKSVTLNNCEIQYTNKMEEDEIYNMQDRILYFTQINEDKISHLHNKIDRTELCDIPSWFLNIDSRSDDGELINYILEVINTGVLDKEKILKEVYQDINTVLKMNDDLIEKDYYIELNNNKDKVKEFISHALKIHHNNLVFEDKKELELLENRNRLLRLVNTKNNINIYRQSFIQLIALFDASVFECFKVHFNENFFVWLKFFENESIKSYDIADNSDFNEFKNMIIEQKLKSLYLKDLLNILHKQANKLFWIDDEDRYVNFREIINRRNCHIHNNGIVDEAYLGIDRKQSVPVFNIYSLNVGDYAEIDREYVNEVIQYCSEFINNFTIAKT